MMPETMTDPTRPPQDHIAASGLDKRFWPETGRPADIARHLRSGGKRLVRDLFHFFLPPLCLACREIVGEDQTLCPACWQKMNFIAAPYCDRLGLPFATDPLGQDHPGPRVSMHAIERPPPYDRLRAVAIYNDVARRMVHGFKYYDRLDLAPSMAAWMYRAGRDVVDEADFIVPLPLHPLRLLARRFNQAGELARRIARIAGKRMLPEGLERIRRTPHQVGLDRAARHRNMQGAFRVPTAISGLVSGSRVLLIDDVLTSGASVNAAVRALKRAGVARVDVLVFCRVAIREPEFIYVGESDFDDETPAFT